MKKLFTAVIFLGLSLLSNAQIITQTTSPSTIGTIIPGYSQVASYNTQTINYTPSTPVNPPTPVDEDTTTEDIKVWDYANPLSVNISMANGNVTNTSIGKVWTLRISVPNALNIGITFQQFNLSATAEMYIFNEARTIVKGSIKKSYFSNTTAVTTSPISGNTAIIYIIEPNNFGALQSVITIQKLMAGYRTIDDVGSTGTVQARGATVNCDPQIMCSQDKLPQARAVAEFFTGNGFQCTGTLINNEANNGRPFFLTAFHCLDINPGIFGGHPGNNVLDPDEIAALQNSVVRFQFWRTACNGTVNNISIDFSGAVVRGSSYISDVVLLELLNPPGVGDGVNYVGWNRGTAEPNDLNSFIIHHPQGEDMRITKTRDVKTFYWNGNFWTAHYSSGTVDRGSSGSALFNEYNQVVGQLRSGWSNCNFTSFGDRYGKFSSSYGLASLGQWLSPTQSLTSVGSVILSPLTIQGPDQVGCSGGDTYYSVPNVLGVSYSWTTSTNLSITSGQSTATISVRNNDPTAVSSGTIQVVINDTKGRNRTVTAQKNVTLGGTIVGTIRQTGQPNKQMQTSNFIVAGYADITLSLPGTTTINCTRTSGTGTWSYSSGTRVLTINLSSGQSASFSMSGTGTCGPVTRTVSFSVSSGGYSFTATPNPVSDNLTIAAVKDNASSDAIAEKDLQFTAGLYDINTGNLVKEMKSIKGNKVLKLNVANIRGGQYILQIEYGKFKDIKQIIINK
jgi:hypothetical protein